MVIELVKKKVKHEEDGAKEEIWAGNLEDASCSPSAGLNSKQTFKASIKIPKRAIEERQIE